MFGKTLLLIRYMVISLFAQKAQDVHGVGFLSQAGAVRLSKTVTMSGKGRGSRKGRRAGEWG